MRVTGFSENAVQSASYAVINSPDSPLKQLIKKCTLEHWTDLIIAILNIRLAFGQEPINTIQLEEISGELYKPFLLAEYLQFCLSGANDYPIYHLAVVIDTVGAQLANPPIKLAKALANIYLSINGQWDKHIGWSLEKLQSRAVKNLDILAIALDVLATIPNYFDFFRGWILVQLAPLLQENGLIFEAIIMAFSSLSNQFKTRSETIAVLTKFQDNLSNLLEDSYPERSLLQVVQKIDNPYLRFRGYLQLIRYFPFCNSHL